MKAFGILCMFFMTAQPARAQMIQSPFSLWSQAYLLHQVMVSEFDALVRREALGNAVDRKIYEQVIERAEFGLNAAKSMAQHLVVSAPLQAALAVKNEKSKNIAEKGSLSGKTSEIVHQLWPEASTEALAPLEIAYNLGKVPCPDHNADVAGFVAINKGIESEIVGPIVKFINGFEVSRVRCLSIALLQAPDKPGHDPYLLLNLMQKVFPELGKDTTLKTLLAVCHIQRGNYPESLRQLFDLHHVAPLYRLAYESLQSQYNQIQQGAGQVAIQSL